MGLPHAAAALLLLALFAGPFGLYIHTRARLEREVPALLASSGLLLILVALALGLTRL